jgi:hypothetical protein
MAFDDFYVQFLDAGLQLKSYYSGVRSWPTSRLPDLLLFIQKLQEETAMEPWAGALMSESDWLLPEEDEVWQDL